MTNDNIIQDFERLEPEFILQALEMNGFHCSGQINVLNSYENRVYQLGLEDAPPVIAKFYRPGRWTDETILEELHFTVELQQFELPVVAPLPNKKSEYLCRHDSFRFSVYPRVGGRAPELDNTEHLQILGRFLARMHNIGATQTFQYRPDISVTQYVTEPAQFLLENNFIPDDLNASYQSVINYLTEELTGIFSEQQTIQTLRLHGDCHLGNILWLDEAPFLVDFDDTRTGPAIQDIWMFLSGDRHYMTARLHDILSGYIEFREFNPAELKLIEPLRTLRLIHYAGWLAKRWHDPAFPRVFPWFNTQRYWEEHILNLKEQMALLQEEPLLWTPD